MINAGYDERKLQETAEVKAELLTDLLLFTRVFFKLRTGRDFEVHQSISRESHYVTMAKALERVFRGECKNLIISIPPRYGKTTLAMALVAFGIANYPDSNYLYVSISSDLATRATSEIKQIITTPYFKRMFGVDLRGDSKAKDSFTTTAGGSIEGLGGQSTIVGKGAGVRGVNRWGGCIIIDDIHAPQSITSDSVRNSVIDWYYSTLQSRKNSKNCPTIYIGQRLHCGDLAAHLMESGDWEKLVIPAIDVAGNALCPQLHDIAQLRRMQELDRYVFAAQFMQNPTPEGGGLFRKEDFPILDKQPNILKTFITCDCAETEDRINDATAISLWGVYRIEQFGKPTDLYGLHWLDCVEIFVEPRDLRDNFMEFYSTACKYGIPSFCGIEKKSAGTYLVSILKEVQGLTVLPIEVNAGSGSKMDRFIRMQPYIAQKLITLPFGARHIKLCLEHMSSITSNDSHRRDDIADTCQQAIQMTMIDKSAVHFFASDINSYRKSEKILQSQLKTNSYRMDSW